MLELEHRVRSGNAILSWAGKDLVGQLTGHSAPGKELVAHVVLCQPDDE